MAIWKAPKTWSSEPLTVTDLNTELRDNLEALKAPPTDSYVANQAGNYATSSLAFVNVDGTNFNLSITTTGGDVIVHFDGSILNAGADRCYLDVAVDDVRDGGNDGYLVFRHSSGTLELPVSFTRLITGLSAGTHTFKLQWKVSTGSATMLAGAGTAFNDTHPQFWVREVS